MDKKIQEEMKSDLLEIKETKNDTIVEVYEIR